MLEGARDPEKYGFRVSDSLAFPDVDAIEIPGALGLSSIASISGVSLEDLKELNPNLRGVTSLRFGL